MLHERNMWKLTSSYTHTTEFTWLAFLPQASFDLRVLSLSESVCVSVRVCGNHLLVHPFNLGSPNLDHRCKRPWLRCLLFWKVIDLNLQGPIWTSKSKVTPFWACRHDNSSPLQARITKFKPEVQSTLVKISINFGIDWSWSAISFSILKPVFYQTYLRCFCKYLVRPSPVYV